MWNICATLIDRGVDPREVGQYSASGRSPLSPSAQHPQLEANTCGDWCLGGRIEANLLSGRAMAGRLLAAEG
jgi:predicted NAD/FAD-dependent oxidoreductase